ncbi:ABC1 kinase family protein [Caenimonas sedimenti]|uniref:ABC1 kinase family protein n=1 Tax=Caenimonas sedimenti TaxID=2596921 RepID=UPI0021028B72|nr:AarF/UbiB family protein [Caenimonas sedimenti]
MLLEAVLSVRDVGRLYEIAAVLIRHGFGDMVRRLGLADALESAGHVLKWQDAAALAHMAPAARVVRALEELGPTFVKLGQMLATRVDLFDPEWIAQLGRLHDHARAASFEDVRAQIIEDLGQPPEEAFAEFGMEPLAAGSLAQVYAARLHTGESVIVKVRRPGIRAVVEADLRLLHRLAQAAESQSPALRIFGPRRLAREFSQSLRRELDFASEARNATRMIGNFAAYDDGEDAAADPGEPPRETPILIPRVFSSCERLCVQQRVEGIAGTRLDLVDEAGLDRRLLARRGARAVLKMIVEDGFFHADPHPGNVFYLQDHRVAFIDFGMVGHLTEERRLQLAQLLVGLVRHEAGMVADVLLAWTGDEAADKADLVAEIEDFVARYSGVSLRQLRFGGMLNEVLAILRGHHLALPSDLGLLIKAFITLEGMGRDLDPDFDMAAEALPVLERALRAHYAPEQVLRRGWASMRSLLADVSSMPGELAALLRALRRGRLDIHVDVPAVRAVGTQIDRAATRLAVGIVVAALIIGSSIVMTVPGGPQ